MSMSYEETYSDCVNNDIDVFRCHCGRVHHVGSGGSISCCPCEFEHEGKSN